MTIKNKIRSKASVDLDILIPAGKWNEYVDLLDREGKFTRRSMLTLILDLCEAVENLENIIEEQDFRIELLEGKVPVKKVEEPIKLRTPADVVGKMEAALKEGQSVLYLTATDWALFEKSLHIDQSSPHTGYNKAIDPIDKKEKTCLLYKEFPVFKKG